MELAESAFKFKSEVDSTVEDTNPCLESPVSDLEKLKVTEGEIHTDVEKSKAACERHCKQSLQGNTHPVEEAPCSDHRGAQRCKQQPMKKSRQQYEQETKMAQSLSCCWQKVRKQHTRR